MDRDPKPGDVRVVGDHLAHRTRIEVWCGEELGWVRLRGVVRAVWTCDAQAMSALNRLELTLEPLLTRYFTSLTEAEGVALRLAGLTDGLLHDAQEVVQRALDRRVAGLPPVGEEQDHG